MAGKRFSGVAGLIAASTAASGAGGHVIGQHTGGRLIRRGSDHAGERGLSRTPLGRR